MVKASAGDFFFPRIAQKDAEKTYLRTSAGSARDFFFPRIAQIEVPKGLIPKVKDRLCEGDLRVCEGELRDCEGEFEVCGR